MVGPSSLMKFCARLETWNPSEVEEFTLSSPLSALVNNPFDGEPAPDGIAGKYGAETAFFAFLAASIHKAQDGLSSAPRRIGSLMDNASWTWLLCSQFAQFQVSSYPSPTSMISRFNNISSLLDNFCHSKFSYRPKVPRVSDVLKYGGWDMNPSNTMFTDDGESDPWRAMSIHADSGLNAGAPNRKSTRTIPECNESPPATEVFGILHSDTVHVPDFRRRWEDESGPVDESLELFGTALNLWLPCFQKPKVALA